ncbi:MAG TPA: hypothetical protein VF581_05555 [Flavobacterium sp.]|jgi:hypothetical protein
MEIKLSTDSSVFNSGNLLDFEMNNQNFDLHNCFEILKIEIVANELFIFSESNELYNEMNSTQKKALINIVFKDVIFEKNFIDSDLKSFTYFVISSENNEFKHAFKKKYAIDIIFDGDKFVLLYCNDIVFQIENE